MRVKQGSKHELAGAIRERYLRADRRGKAAMLDEFVSSTGYHRKAAIRLLRQGAPPPRRGHGGRPRCYSSVVVGSLRVAAEATGWTECQALWGKGQAAVVDALEQIRDRLPFPLLGIDSDNGSEFLNDHLLRWCRRQEPTFTRSRPYWRNDQAHVEQKNWSVVRRLVGYDRYESRDALAALQAVYAPLRLWTNHWQPTLKLIAKERDGARVRKRYDTPQTPYRRALATAALDRDARLRLDDAHAASGPVTLRRRLDAAILALDRHHTRPVDPLADVAG